jgi:hypothetical protein
MNDFTRCTARAKALDSSDDVVRRCRELTDAWVEEFELGVLWDNYGLVGDIIVSIFL